MIIEKLVEFEVPDKYSCVMCEYRRIVSATYPDGKEHTVHFCKVFNTPLVCSVDINYSTKNITDVLVCKECEEARLEGRES